MGHKYEFYVVNLTRGYTDHEGDEASCVKYVQNVRILHNINDQFLICEGATKRDEVLKSRQPALSMAEQRRYDWNTKKGN